MILSLRDQKLGHILLGRNVNVKTELEFRGTRFQGEAAVLLEMK